MLDIVLAVVLALVMLATAYLGVHVTLHPPQQQREKRLYQLGFGACAIFACVLIAVQTYRTNEQQNLNIASLSRLGADLNASNAKLDRANSTLQSTLLSAEYMKGQLSGLSMMVAHPPASGLSGTDQAVAAALLQISKQQSFKPQPTGVDPPAIQRFTSKQLREKVLDLIKDMRQTASEFEVASMARSVQRTNAMQAANKQDGSPTGPMSSKAWQDANAKDDSARNQYALYVSQNYVGIATEYKDELLRRLGPQKPPAKNNPMAEMQQNMLLWSQAPGMLSYSAQEVLATAQYLETLARQLP